jgi:hypothetical protein
MSTFSQLLEQSQQSPSIGAQSGQPVGLSRQEQRTRGKETARKRKLDKRNAKWAKNSVFAGQAETSGQLDQVGAQAAQLGGLRSNVLQGIDTAESRIGGRNRRQAANVVQQQFGDQQTGAVTHGDVLNNALRRAKTRTGIAQRGDSAIRNQQLKDRLEQVRQGIAGQARGIDLQTAGQDIKSGVALGRQSASERIAASNASAVGGILGIAGGTLKGNKDKKGSLGYLDFGKAGKGL